MDKINDQLGRLEALLFIHGEAMPKLKAFAVLGLTEDEGQVLLNEFAASLAAESRGLTLVESGGKVQLVTKPAHGQILEQFVKEELSEDLSPASLETLAIIAYYGPVSRARIEYLRGVNSSFILRSLLLRGLVERLPDPTRPASYVYQPSIDLLKHLGVARREDLPSFAEFRESLEKLESTPAVETSAVPAATAEPAKE